MRMWILILWTVMAFWGLSLYYIGARLPRFLLPASSFPGDRLRLFWVGLLLTVGLAVVLILCFDLVNAVVCMIYLAMIWALADLICFGITKITDRPFQHDYAGWAALLITLISLGIGWYQAHHVWQKNYTLTTDKLNSPLKIALIADAHVGTTFDGKTFAQHAQKIETQHPDLFVIAGDFVDDNTTKEDMLAATRALGQINPKYGTYFVFGNHDKGYYGAQHRGFSGDDLVRSLRHNGVRVLRDQTVLIDDTFYVIGRKDFSEVQEKSGHRRDMNALLPFQKNKYMIVLDHQPADYENQARSGVDLVLSGHTHGGQLRPFNLVGKWIGANDLVYGHEKRGETDFIVTSGLSAWAIKFKTGTKSEYVMIHIMPKKEVP